VIPPSTVTGDPAPAFDLSGGVLCLDFVNTLGNRLGPEPLEEGLAGYGDLVEFARQSGVLDGAGAKRLLQRAEARPAEAAATLVRAVALRESIHDVFDALADGRAPAREALDGLNDELGVALAHARVAPSGSSYALAWDDPDSALDRPLWPIARSAMDLLLESDLTRVGECESETCGFLFLDSTRNRSRRWCDTRICGNRARVRRHRSRQAEGD
jgi:predicted RNA-binding Zn ribbon-like protein